MTRKRPQRLGTVSALGRAPARIGTPAPPPVSPDGDGTRWSWPRIKRWTRGAMLDNLGLKFVSVVLALTMFVLVNTDREREITINVPVSYTVPEGKALVSERVDQVHVTVKGPWRRIRRFDDRELDPIQIDLTRIRGGEVPITADLVHVPAGLRVTSITPRVVRVAFERRASKEVDVAPVLTGRPLHGFEVKRTQVDPARITVRGAEGLIAALSVVRTEEIRIDGRSESFDTQAALIPPDGIEVSWEGPVGVQIQLEEQLVTRRVGPLPVAPEVPGLDPARLAVEPAEVTVVLTGRLRSIERALAEGVRPVARLPANDPRTRTFPVEVEGLPAGVGVQVVPPQVNVSPRR